MGGPSVALTTIDGEQDCALLWQWLASVPGIHGSGNRPFPNLEGLIEHSRQPDTNLMMVCTNDGRAIGCVDWQMLAYPGSVQVGIMVGDQSLWGAGFGIEAVLLLLEFLFHSRNMHRVQFITALFNKEMMRVVCGSEVIRIDGILRDYFYLDGTYHDAILGTILRAEYYAMTKAANLSPKDVVPREDKDGARQVLAKYLAEHPIALQSEGG